jgi:DNA-nicking Smr family endonuclease
LNNKFSDKDKKDWDNFVFSDENVFDKDASLLKKNIKNYLVKTIDLHGFPLSDANKAVYEFINKSFEEYVDKIIVITGKGSRSKNENNPYLSKDLSILKYSVPDFIKSNENLMKIIKNISEAKIEDGGSGALYIYLKKNKK